jgi:beta-1,4-mannosyl-glycoprotein beta-1,4-N-acetylglucosaminyltransferase
MFDCFMMNNELDIVDIRFHTLDAVVEKFIVVESPFTHSGKQKELHFFNNISRFEKFRSKIIYLQSTRTPPEDYIVSKKAWFFENVQRDKIIDALSIGEPEDGLFFVSDVDEIPRPEKLLEAKQLYQWNNWPIALDLYNCMYFLNYSTSIKLVRGPYLYNPSLAKEVHDKFTNNEGEHPDADPSTFRWHMGNASCITDFPRVTEAGWHFSTMGGVKAIKQKLESCAHLEFDNPKFKSEEYLLRCMEEGITYFDDLYNFDEEPAKYVKQDLTFLPLYVQANLKKFEKYILK